MNKEIFEEWKVHPATIEIFKEIESVKDSLKDELARGGTLRTSADASLSATSRMIGNIEGLNQLLNISYEVEGDDV